MDQKRITWYATITAAILTVPFIAMQVTSEVNWGLGDFLFIGVLLFGSGLLYELIARRVTNRKYRVVLAAVIVLGILIVWGMAAVGLDYIDAHLAY